MITEQDIGAYKDALEVFEGTKETIVDRIDEVIKVIAKVFKRRVSRWWFPNAREGGLGDFDSRIVRPHHKDGSDEIDIERSSGGCMETDEWDYTYSFPRKFLFMNDNDIRAEIKDQIKKTEESATNKKEKRVQNSIEKEKLKASAAEKLTPKEKKALGIK